MSSRIALAITVLAGLAGLAAASPAAPLSRRAPKAVTWDCTNTPESCNNACYAVACKGKSWQLTYGGPGSSDAQRVLSGASVQPCAQPKGTYDNVNWQDGDNSLVVTDEYPFASSTQGGEGAILRCTTSADGSSQGSEISGMWTGVNKGDDVLISLTDSINPDSIPFCAPFWPNAKVSPSSVCDNSAGYEFLQDSSTVHAGQGVKKKFVKA